jgi:hypothetical protein
VLLLASRGYELTGLGGLDSIGAILIALLTFAHSLLDIMQGS